MTTPDWNAIAKRFLALYVPAVCDALDEHELRYQYVHHSIQPLSPGMRVAGPAYTIIGRSNSSRDTSIRLGSRVIESFTPGVVAVYDTMGDQETGVWGELWAEGAVRKGCAGAVVDGGIRDTGFIRRLGFPIFRKFHSPGDALGRFNIVDHNVRVNIGGVAVSPGDYVFGDDDGVVFVPKAMIIDILKDAEEIAARESLIRSRVHNNEVLADLADQYGKV